MKPKLFVSQQVFEWLLQWPDFVAVDRLVNGKLKRGEGRIGDMTVKVDPRLDNSSLESYLRFEK